MSGLSSTSDWTTTEWLNAQAGCIGCVLQSPKLAARLLAETTEDDFDGPGKMVYQAIRALREDDKSPDAVQVAEKLNKEYDNYILQCVEIVPSVYGFDGYLATLREKARMSRIQTICYRAAAASTMEQMREEIASLNEQLVEAANVKSVSMKEMFLDWRAAKTSGERFVKTGFARLDEQLRLREGNVVVLAARPSRGKTALALQMAYEQSINYRVGFYSYETGARDVMDRMISQITGIPFQKISGWELTENETAQIDRAYDKISRSGFEFIDAAGMTPDDVFAEAIARNQKIIYIDYIQIMKPPGKAQYGYESVTAISTKLHELARKHKILVFELAQLNRAVNARDTEEPNMADIRESGQIEQDADLMLMLYCYQKDLTAGPRILKVAKNKSGPAGARMPMSWQGEVMRMEPTSRYIAECEIKAYHQQPRVAAQPQPRELEPLPENTPIPPELEQMEIPQGNPAKSERNVSK